MVIFYTKSKSQWEGTASIFEFPPHKSIYRVQQYCWPHLLRFNSLILVNGEKTGKTFAYLPIICSLVTMEKDDIPEHEKGPVAILLTQSRCEAEQLGKLSKYFTKSTVVCTDEQNLKDSLGKLLNPVDVLVCTINGMKILDEKNNKYRWFSKDRLKHFVVENIDTWNFEKLNELNGIMEKFGIKKIDDIQIVITSRIWSPFLKSLLKLKSFNNPLICIGAHIESAVYANTEFLLKIVQSDLKINCILEFLQKHLYEEQKTIIVCNSNEDTELVATKLRSLSYNTSVCTNKNSADDITKIKTDWKHYDDSRKSILVCTDSTLPDLDIKDAKNLIHYSLSSSWTQTCFRFSVFLKYHEDNLLITDGTFAEPKTLPATTLILLDESNNDHLPRLINFLDRNKIPINSAIRKLVKRIEIEREKSQNSETRPFCSKFLEFGKSHNLSVCLGRHVLTTKDQSNDDIPTNGQIKIQVLSVESPTYYYVRILEYKTLNDHAWKCIRKSNEYTGFSMKFAMYFGDSNNHQTYYPIVLNDICVAVDKGNYYRCKIVNVKKMELRDRIDYTVRAKLVDNGQTLSFRSSQLLYLPKQFRDFPHQAVDLRVLGIIPYDKEEVWDKITLETVRKWIETYSENQKLITTATINFSILNTIFVDEIVIKTELSALNTYVDRILIKKNLIEKKLVLKETDVENNIKELAFELGLLILENDIKSPEKKSSGADSSSNPKSSHSSVSNTSSKCISSNRSGLKTKIQQNVTSEKSNIKKLSQISNESVPKAIKENVKEAVTEGAESKMSKFKESWSNLIQDKFSKVVIGIFYSPDNFYVYNISEYLIDRTNKLYAKIQEHIDEGHAPIDKPSIGQNCLAEFDGNYNRCKIIGLVSENGEIFVTVFYCDIGAIRKMELKSVLTTKEEIVNMLPFQAIRCSLVGLASRKENGLWDKEESNEIYDKFIGPSTSLYSRPVITETPKKDGILEYWNYQIVLLDCSDKAFYDQINKAILAEGLATKDPENEHYMDIFENPDILEKDCDYESEEEEWQDNKYQPNFIYPEQDDLVSSKSFDVHFDDNELKDLLEMAKQTGIYKVVENTPKEACITEINESHVTEKETSCITEIKESDKHKESVERNTAEGVKSKIIKTTVTDNNKQSNDTVSTSEKNVHLKENIPKLRPLSEILKSKKTFISRTNNMKPKPLLKDLYKTPNVVWQQSENLICLYISAPNVTDYTILASRMELFYRAVIDNEINSLCLNLFGPSDCVTHEIRGLSVVVRIEKTLKGKAYQWPRLTNEKDKHSWLKYNYDSLLFEDDENIGLNHFKSNPNIDSDDRSSLGSQSGYDNFVDVTNADNLYDPLDDGHFLN